MWLDKAQKSASNGDTIDITWKPFSLDQLNQKIGEGYKVWDEPEDNLPPAVWALRACIAARRQSPGDWDGFLMALLRARHEERKDLGDIEMLVTIAEENGLDAGKFRTDLMDRSALREIEESHNEAVESHGVFGTPTFVFPSGGSAFVKMVSPDTADDSSRSLETLIALIEGQPFIGEVKRPQPPWPRGVVGG